MKKSGHVPIKVALYGMDPRSLKTMELYLKGPCRGIAIVVNESEADVDIIDADFATAAEILENRRLKTPQRPIVLLSLQPLKIENTFFIQKPVTAEQLMAVLSKFRPVLPVAKAHPEQARPASTKSPVSGSAVTNADGISLQKAKLEAALPIQHAPKVSKRRAAMENNEGGFTAFLGTLVDIDFNDASQLHKASFDPKSYLLGYVLSAYKVARHQSRALQLNSIWKPVLFFPESHEVWLDADDKQLRVFAGMEQNKMFASNINLTPIDARGGIDEKARNMFQDVDAFIWKLATWTSKGRFPLGLDPKAPIYLKHWPNFTRLLLTPDALRIAALLVQGPRSPLEVIQVLKVKPQYVFAFISACYSLGMLGKSERRVDETMAPEPPKPNKRHGLLSRILNKLRGD
ncbi:hypothetical protein IVG45_21315 [Methylomonas sp. LL1]|uniref:hypothetical protein n=1 Tax=Methylomonas sp. LL1 TaxID=2785785 RepID=UPI0018C41547|nr:hypothetical protein [Methylomonas sp. LL1]QPK63307.1 hypothetical protein IVG45_21315 [Methylomonas sp. LL1]